MALELTDLAQLPGAPDANFEALTRAIVSRRFGRVGTIRERRNQPGVEFYLRVDHFGELGSPGRVWGWSCKWFILGADYELTKGQRLQIEDSLAKAVKWVDGLTDFVLCLPQRPTKQDEEWIAGLGAGIGVATRLWACENFDAELAGHDELRSTFFGELALTGEELAKAHERSVAPVKARWAPPELHTATHVEHQIEQALLRPVSFDWLEEHAEAIAARAKAVREALPEINGDLHDAAEQIIDDLEQFVGDLLMIVEAGRKRRPLEARQLIIDRQPPSTTPRALRALVLALRKRRLPAALAASGLAAEIADVVERLQAMRITSEAPMIAVVGAAGRGKTHLGAQLTSSRGGSTAGVFIPGGRLQSGGSLDDLAKRIPGLKTASFEDLLEALNSAGSRTGARIPVVIDGLNEAERPSEWRMLLDEVVPALNDFPNVLLVVTLRESLALYAVPNAAAKIELEWEQSEVAEIVRAYFEHYLIKADGAWLPTGMFHNPLFVRMYCDAANAERLEPVGVESLPTSLVGVFELYRDGVTERLAQDPARKAVPADEIRRRLTLFAIEVWERRDRQLPSEHAKAILDATETSWDESLFRRLEEEGVIFREEVDGSIDTQTGILFDRFAGYLIADALLTRMVYSEVYERLADAELWDSLLGEEAHPLGEDVAIGLIGLLPRRFASHHLWTVAPEAHRKWVLAQELDTESEFLNRATIDELAVAIAASQPQGPRKFEYHRRHPFDRLREVRRSPAHCLNALFLDRVLREMPLPVRDQTWTEWVRFRSGDLITQDLKPAIKRWSETLERSESDDLDALAVAWLLTSTNQDVRDLATKALQRYGRPEPNRLFDLATRMLNVEDPYVVERIIGAAFGAACSRQMPDPGGASGPPLTGWLCTLRDHFLIGGSTPTSHELVRNYIRATFEFAGTLHPDAVPSGIDPARLMFADTSPIQAMSDDDPNVEESGITLRMDFENYVIGGAISGRANYDSDHDDFRRARGEVLARVWDLGWRSTLFGEIDESISGAANRYGSERVKVERYGKKYGWIAYYELIGRIVDSGQSLPDWSIDRGRVVHDVDPTFPEEPPVVSLSLPKWAPPGRIDDETWVRSGAVDVPLELWSPSLIHDVSEDWLLIEGFLEHRRDGRTAFGFFHTMLFGSDDVDQARSLVQEAEYLGNRFFPKIPTIRGVFAGEAPWSPRFEEIDPDDPAAEDRPALRRDYQDEGIELARLAVELPTGDGESSTSLKRSYEVPSFEFAAHFGLRQMPGTLDLVGLDGRRASACFRTPEPWRGQLLFIRRDLVEEFAGDRRIMQVAWGEREAAVDWRRPPAWARSAQRSHENLWREVRVLP